MLPISDQDLELLDAYMDGELPDDEAHELRRRLDVEAALASTLETLRAEAHVRSAIWKACEPDDAAVHRLIARVDASVDRHTIWAHRLLKLRMVGAAAACIVLGLVMGRVVYWQPPAGSSSPSIENTTSVGAPAGQVLMRPPAPQPGGPVQFRIVDGNGNPITLQPFKSQKQANEFLNDLARWQREQAQMRSAGTTLPSSGQF